MRELDRRTIEEAGIPGEVLMERAGAGIARCVERLSSFCECVDPEIVLVAGKGNNGGDIFVTARILKKRGFRVEVLVCAASEDIRGDALAHFKLMKQAGIEPVELPEETAWEHGRPGKTGSGQCDIIVDGVLGTGISGVVRGAAAGAIKYINRVAADAFVVSADVPSGMNSDDGSAAGDVVRADVTVTMGLPKRGFTEPAAIENIGTVEVVDLGIPENYIDDIHSDRDLIVLQDFVNVLADRPRNSHKGDYGHALLIGGANGCAGAIAMSAASAVRSGAGLVTVVTPKSVAAGVCSVSPESMVYWAEETETGSLSASCLDLLNIDVGSYSAVLIGPGLTTNDEGLAVLEAVLKKATAPVVVDADALNLCVGRKNIFKEAKCPLILTPHPGEMARLMSVSSNDIQSDRRGMAAKLVEQTNAIVVLKGAGTLVCGCGGEVSINLTGNPGMASGGMGDVLAGLLAGLISRGVSSLAASKMAVFLHGMAGDRVAWRASEEGLVASDVIREIPYVLGLMPAYYEAGRNSAYRVIH